MSSSGYKAYSSQGGQGRRNGRPWRDSETSENWRRPNSTTVGTQWQAPLKDAELLRARNQHRFSEQGTSKTESTGTQWSQQIWKYQKPSVVAKDVSQSAGTLPKARPGAISLGRATGISRVPDEALCQSPHRVQTSLHSLLKRAACLENSGDTLVSGGVDISTVASASDDIINEWDSILAQYRQLTMAITASASGVMDDLAIPVYEGAADASLLAGNLDYYLSCQTRLLQDLYNSNPTRKNNALRHDEFTAYSLLYFGVFQPNSCEVAHITRGMSKQTFASSFVKLSLSAITAFRDLNGLSFISIYRRSTVRQRTILNPKLDLMMRHGMNALLRTYLELDRSFALKCLGLKADPDFLRLLKSERPDLAEKNPQTGLNFIFRVPVRK